MSPVIIKIIASIISTLLGPLAKGAWGFIKLKYKVGKNNTQIEKDLAGLKGAIGALDDDTPINEEQKNNVIDAARNLIRGY